MVRNINFFPSPRVSQPPDTPHRGPTSVDKRRGTSPDRAGGGWPRQEKIENFQIGATFQPKLVKKKTKVDGPATHKLWGGGGQYRYAEMGSDHAITQCKQGSPMAIPVRTV